VMVHAGTMCMPSGTSICQKISCCTQTQARNRQSVYYAAHDQTTRDRIHEGRRQAPSACDSHAVVGSVVGQAQQADGADRCGSDPEPHKRIPISIGIFWLAIGGDPGCVCPIYRDPTACTRTRPEPYRPEPVLSFAPISDWSPAHSQSLD
jgi:hypothetical protein